MSMSSSSSEELCITAADTLTKREAVHHSPPPAVVSHCHPLPPLPAVALAVSDGPCWESKAEEGLCDYSWWGICHQKTAAYPFCCLLPAVFIHRLPLPDVCLVVCNGACWERVAQAG